MSIRHIKGSTVQQASRLHRPTPELAWLIEVTNLVPAEDEFPDLLSEIVVRDLPALRALASFRRSIESRFPMPRYAKFRKFIGPIRPKMWSSATERYSFIRIAREVLRTISNAPNPGPLQLPPMG